MANLEIFFCRSDWISCVYLISSQPWQHTRCKWARQILHFPCAYLICTFLSPFHAEVCFPLQIPHFLKAFLMWPRLQVPSPSLWLKSSTHGTTTTTTTVTNQTLPQISISYHHQHDIFREPYLVWGQGNKSPRADSTSQYLRRKREIPQIFISSGIHLKIGVRLVELKPNWMQCYVSGEERPKRSHSSRRQILFGIPFPSAKIEGNECHVELNQTESNPSSVRYFLTALHPTSYVHDHKEE